MSLAFLRNSYARLMCRVLSDYKDCANARFKQIWNLKAKQFPRFVKDAPDTLEILEFLRASGACFEGKSLIDIGCGNGRFALQLAPQVREIVGFDTSDVMLSALLEDAARLGLGNVKTLQGDWQDFIPPKTFDIAFASMTPH